LCRFPSRFLFPFLFSQYKARSHVVFSGLYSESLRESQHQVQRRVPGSTKARTRNTCEKTMFCFRHFPSLSPFLPRIHLDYCLFSAGCKSCCRVQASTRSVLSSGFRLSPIHSSYFRYLNSSHSDTCTSIYSLRTRSTSHQFYSCSLPSTPPPSSLPFLPTSPQWTLRYHPPVPHPAHLSL